MHSIYLDPPEIQGQTVTFRWRITPETHLYRHNHFSFQFPDSVDLTRVPQRLWWDILLICLHAHWLLLRPCEIHLPIRLGAAERHFWLQHLRNGLDTLDGYRQTAAPSGPLDIDIVDGVLECPRAIISGHGYGAAFSGGKDSLLQAGLLAELTDRPLLVATTSPLPPLEDHDTARREQVFAAIQARRPVRFVEVHSDLRACWDNGFPYFAGYDVALNELTDTHVYLGALLATAAASGVTRLFLASEAELQETVVIDGKIVQFHHFMYSAATQRSFSRLLAGYGISYGSLTWPLYSWQVQQLLWERYPDICDLQYSCWRVPADRATCSECSQCLRIALTALVAGRDPRSMGIDLPRLLAYAPQWEPMAPPAEGEIPRPRETVARRAHALVQNAIRRTSLIYLTRLLTDGALWRVATKPIRDQLAAFRVLRQRTPPTAAPPLGVREAFCEWLDPDLRDRLTEIYASHLGREPRELHFATFDRSRVLTERATAPLDWTDADSYAA